MTTATLEPYTLEEVNAILDAAEADFEAGLGIPHEEVMREWEEENARYSETERRQYEESKKVFWDNYSVLKTAREKGMREGVLDIAHKMKSKGFSVEDISEITGLSIEEVETL